MAFGLTVRVKEVGWFDVQCARQRRHRITVRRIVTRSPSGVKVRTKLSLPCGGEVRYTAGRYEADGVGPLFRMGLAGRGVTPSRSRRGRHDG
jgi:hypothetical protein